MIRGRIIKGVGGLYFIDVNNKVYECSARGIFRKRKITPTVGDYAEVLVLDEENLKGSIENICERTNISIRPRVANVDCCIITFAAASPDINLDLLDRFLILAEQQKLNVIICINKIDLADEALIQDIKRIYSPMYKVICTDTRKKIGIEEVKDAIRNKVSVFAGPSGVGKSSLINCLVPDGNLKTGEISRKIERGKHTTRQVELMPCFENTYIVDSPGFTSLSLEHIDCKDLQFYFKEFRPFLEKCRFNDCCHLHEPDCGVKEQIGIEISEERYNRYEFLFNELRQRK